MKKNDDNKQKLNNVIDFRKEKEKRNKKITDNDINALFLGLLKIVKRTALERVSEELREENKLSNENFLQTLKEMQTLKTQLKKAEEKNKNLQYKIEYQKRQICLLIGKGGNRILNNNLS